MNIFILSSNVDECAAAHCDKHVVKMILEYAQIMSTVNRVPGAYKPTHVHHPATLWAAQTTTNYAYLYSLWRAVCREYTARFGRIHATEAKMSSLLYIDTISGDLTVPPSIMDHPIIPCPRTWDDVVENYRHLYKTEKRHIVSYNHGEAPIWL